MAGAQADPLADSLADPLADPAVGLAAGPAPGSGAPSGRRRRWLAVAAEGFASGAPNAGLNEILPIWLASHQVPVELIGLLPLAGLPYTLKALWAPLLDRWPLPWPDRRRGWILLLQLLLALAIALLALLRPDTRPATLAAIGGVMLLVALLSSSQDIVIDAYRTDLLPANELGGGAAANSLGYRLGTLALGSGGLILAGSLGYPLAFLAAAIALCLAVVRSRIGHVLVAIRENESRTAMLGYDVARYKLIAFVLSGSFAAFAGACYALMFAYAGSSLASIQYSIHPLLWTLLGGAATVLGPVLGTALMFFLVDFASGFTTASLLFVGVALILLVLFFPKGILGTLRQRVMPWLP